MCHQNLGIRIYGCQRVSTPPGVGLVHIPIVMLQKSLVNYNRYLLFRDSVLYFRINGNGSQLYERSNRKGVFSLKESVKVYACLQDYYFNNCPCSPHVFSA